MRATLKDIAEETGLSVSSVSLVLNGRPNRISEKNRQKIIETARKLNYRPNQNAVSLITKRSRVIGLVMPDMTNMFFAQIAKGAESRSRELGYSLILCNTNDSPEKDVDYINVLLSQGVDGILLVSSYRPGGESSDYDPEKEHLLEKPVVLIDRRAVGCPIGEKVSGVFADNEVGGYLATKHLISLGHTKIGCITGPLGAASAKNRLFGHIRALQEAGLPFDRSLVREGDFHTDSGFVMGEQLLNKGVTAVFAGNDMMAYGVYRAAGKMGLKVPDDLSIVGFDDLKFSEIVEPPLTTVRQNSREMGRNAVDKIVAMINGKEEPVFTMQPELIVRKSTAEKVK